MPLHGDEMRGRVGGRPGDSHEVVRAVYLYEVTYNCGVTASQSDLLGAIRTSGRRLLQGFLRVCPPLYGWVQGRGGLCSVLSQLRRTASSHLSRSRKTINGLQIETL